MAAKRHLTPKQERFALEYFKTGNASEAYRIAYDCQKMKPESINRKALVELDKGMIRARVEQLRNKAETKAVLTKERALEILAEIAEQGQDKDKVAALKQAGKMNGWEAPTRQQIEHALASPFEKFIEAAQEDQGNDQPAETVSGD
jgi:phage terminase small subunit